MKKRKHGALAMTAALALGGTLPAFAQQASTLQSNEERLRRYFEQQQKVVPAPLAKDPLAEPVAPARPAAALPGETRFELKAVTFTASELVPAQVFADAAKPFIGKTVDGKDLADLLAAVNAVYIERNITTARAVMGPQDIVDGNLHIELVEGRLGELNIEGDKQTREGFIRDRIGLSKGKVLDSSVLRDRLVRLNKTTELQVRATLQPGTERGETDVRLDVVEPDAWGVDIFADNNGSDSTGRERVGIQGFVYGLLGRDDRFQANVSHSRGGNDGALSYAVPVTPWNGRVALNASRSQINIINGAFAGIDVVGKSTVYGLEFNQPVVANANWLVTGIASFSLGKASTAISGVQIADSKTRLWTAGASVQHLGEGRQWGFTQLYTSIHSDEPMLGRSRFQTFPGNAFVIQRLGQTRWIARGSLGWQFSKGDLLPSANLFQIGGPGSVRGYERGILSGTRGYYGSVELHRLVNERLDLYGFADHGAVSGFYPDTQRISGAGLGGLWRVASWLTLSGDIAKAINTVVPDQDNMRFNLRFVVHWR